MQVNPLTFYGVCAMAVLGFIHAVITVMRKEPEQRSLFDAPTEMPEAPAGCVWVAVQTRHADRARQLFGPKL